MRFWKRTTSAPSDETFENGAKYYSIISWDGSNPGEIFDDSEVLRWRCELRPARSPRSPLNLYRKPAFVVRTPDGNEVVVIRRVRRFPAKFEMVDHEKVVGIIRLQSILRNKYLITLSDGYEWTVRMPLFTVYFWAESSEGSRIWIIMGPVMKWSYLVEPGCDNAHLVSALSFIHREWCVYS